MAERILIVEDSRPMREVLAEYLAGEGYECAFAETGTVGLACIAKQPYDLILTDLRLPGADGFKIVERANELQPETPKIIMTAYSEFEDALRALRLGAYDFLRKPISELQELGLLVRRALEHRRLVRERAEYLAEIERMNQELGHFNEHLENEVQRRTEELSKANQQLRTLDEMKNNLLANVSHELRTPLVSVRGYTELFRGGHLCEIPDNACRYLDISLRNIDKLLMLIESLVRYADLARDKAPMNLAELDLCETALRTRESLAGEVEKAGMCLEVESPDQPLLVNADVGFLQQALTHLVQNAIKFNHPGTHIRIKVEMISRSLVKVSVIDDGVGIPQDEQAQIFERFYQIDGGPTRQHGGTGMGLAIVRDNMRLMGCEVRVNSEAGHGATFFWSMPVKSALMRPEEDAPREMKSPGE